MFHRVSIISPMYAIVRLVGILRRWEPSSPGVPSRQDASKRIPATKLPGPCYPGWGCWHQTVQLNTT